MMVKIGYRFSNSGVLKRSFGKRRGAMPHIEGRHISLIYDTPNGTVPGV
jgi:hypothetical protein